MSRDEALVAVLNAARVVRKQTPLGDYLPVHVGQCLAQLYAAIDAVDAVGEMSPPGLTPIGPGLWVSKRTVPEIRAELAERRGLCQGDPDCWRYADVGTTCYHHSPAAALPSLRRRDAALEVQSE